MALTKPVPRAAPATDAPAEVKSVGTFESMEETVATKPAANDPPPRTDDTPPSPAAPAASVPASPAPAPANAVATVKATPVAPVRAPSEFVLAVQSMKGDGDFSYGSNAIYKGVQGSIKGTTGDKLNLGSWVKVTMIAWDDRFQISPGSDADSAKDYVAYSKDGETIESLIGRDKLGDWVGRSIHDYMEFLRDRDLPKASMSKYVDVICIVHGGEKAAANALAGEPIMVTLSQSSIPSFSEYQSKLETKAKALARGGALAAMIKVPEDPFTFYFVAEAVSKGDKDWTKLRVSDRQPVDA